MPQTARLLGAALLLGACALLVGADGSSGEVKYEGEKDADGQLPLYVPARERGSVMLRFRHNAQASHTGTESLLVRTEQCIQESFTTGCATVLTCLVAVQLA